MAVKVGFKGVLKVGDLEIGDARDVTLETTAEMVETSRRSDEGWKSWLQGWKEWSVSFDVVWDNVSDALANMRTAYINGTTMSISMLDDDGDGVTGTILVETFPKAEPLKDAMNASITLRGTGAFTVVEAVS